ncbi:MAG: MurR/RpiR family transcriptional regulator [Pyrinomonadaceae bacterium]
MKKDLPAGQLSESHLSKAKISNADLYSEVRAPADGRTVLEARFLESQTKLSASRQKLLTQILEEADETFFLSSRDLGRRYGVDTATIVRTVQAMGYKRFADFTHDLRNHFVTQITPYASMRAATKKQQSVDDYVHQSLDNDLANLNSLKSSFNAKTIVGLAKQIQGAHRIVVVGLDFASSLALSLAYALVRLGCDAEAPMGGRGSVQNKVGILTGKDLLIAISFGKCLRETVEAVLQARQHNVPTFGITDGDGTPIARYCDNYVTASTGRSSFLDSYVAPVAVINAILVACAHSRPKRSLESLEQFDKGVGARSRWFHEKDVFD